MEENELILEVKPKYKMIYQILKRIETPLILLFLMIPAVKLDLLFVYLSIVFVYIAFMIACITYGALKYKNYKYEFYKDELVYVDSFINKSKKTIKYEDMKEIYYNQDILQRIFKIGNITITTNGFNLFNNGVTLLDIENVDNVYNKIREIINNKG